MMQSKGEDLVRKAMEMKGRSNFEVVVSYWFDEMRRNAREESKNGREYIEKEMDK
jgi:hypothetical protein